MISPEDTHVSLIPRNFIERGTFMGGMFKIRNAVEGGILATVVTVPVIHLPLTVTARIIIFCVTALPAAMVAFIGIGGESLTATTAGNPKPGNAEKRSRQTMKTQYPKNQLILWMNTGPNAKPLILLQQAVLKNRPVRISVSCSLNKNMHESPRRWP